MGQAVRNRAVAGASLGAVALLLATGCSFDFSLGSVSVDSEEVAEQASSALEEQVGRAPEDVTCPEDLSGEVGESIRCELTDSGQTYGVTVTVTSVEGSNVDFDVAVDEEPSN